MRSSWSIFRTVAVWLLILVLAGVAGRHRADQRRVVLTQQLLDQANRCAIAFGAEDTRALTGTRADLGTAPYLAVKDRLQRLRAVNPDVRFIYLLRSTGVTGRVVFLADSEPAQSVDESLPGDDYPEALNSPGLQSILLYHRSSTEGPLRDSFGEWMTAYAPVGDPPTPGRPSVVLGLDVDVLDWQWELWKTGLTTFSYVLLMLGAPFGVWMFLHRERQFNREIRRLSAAIQQSHSMVLITDVERRIEYANDGCTAATGYAVDELIGQPTRLLLPDDTSEHQRTELRETLLQGRRWQGELRIRRRNGETFPARAVFSPVRNQNGTIINLVGVIDDVSEQKKVEDAYRIARDQAESADRAKGEFLAMMSHELRTPLNGIIGFAALLQDTQLTSEQRDFAGTIRTSGESLLTLTNELLDYSRIDAGRMQLDPQTCSPRLLIEEAAELLSARAAEKNLELLVSVAPDVPAHVITDPGRLRQVLVNLLGNAIKFTPAGEVDIAVTVRPLQIHPSRMRLHVTVRDTGVGIAAEDHADLFKPFSQIDASATRKHGGTGLGLAISRSLVRLMGGEIEVESAAGAGSIFHFYINVELVEASVPLAPLSAKRVAVISGNARAREHYAALLKSWGLVPTPVENLAALEGQPKHDLLLVDVLRRDATRWSALLSKRGENAEAPVVGLVPVGLDPSLRDELRESFHTVLKKPMRDSLFHAVLKKLTGT